MKLIQIFILLALVGLFGLVEYKLKNRSSLKMLLMAIVSLGIGLAIFPDYSHIIARSLGVGRGADLIFYMAIVGLSASCLLLYLKIIHLEQKITDLSRNIALSQAMLEHTPTDNSLK